MRVQELLDEISHYSGLTDHIRIFDKEGDEYEIVKVYTNPFWEYTTCLGLEKKS